MMDLRTTGIAPGLLLCYKIRRHRRRPPHHRELRQCFEFTRRCGDDFSRVLSRSARSDVCELGGEAFSPGVQECPQFKVKRGITGCCINQQGNRFSSQLPKLTSSAGLSAAKFYYAYIDVDEVYAQMTLQPLSLQVIPVHMVDSLFHVEQQKKCFLWIFHSSLLPKNWYTCLCLGNENKGELELQPREEERKNRSSKKVNEAKQAILNRINF